MTVYVVTNGKAKPSKVGGHVFPYISTTRDDVERACGMTREMAEELAAEGWGEALPQPQGVAVWTWPDHAEGAMANAS